MKKRILAIATVLMLSIAPAMAQIFILDDDEFNSNRADGDASMVLNNPWEYNMGVDVYVPVGEGVALLAGLAGAYLLGKRKKDQE